MLTTQDGNVFSAFWFLQEILEKRSEMMNEYKRFRERATEEWESMKYRRLELRDGKWGSIKYMLCLVVNGRILEILEGIKWESMKYWILKLKEV